MSGEVDVEVLRMWDAYILGGGAGRGTFDQKRVTLKLVTGYHGRSYKHCCANSCTKNEITPYYSLKHNFNISSVNGAGWKWTDKTLPGFFDEWESYEVVDKVDKGESCAKMNITRGTWQPAKCKKLLGLVCKSPIGKLQAVMNWP